MAGEPPPHIEVDLGEVREVITWLRHEEQALAQERHRLVPGFNFGEYTPCGETSAARSALATALDDLQNNTNRYSTQVLTLTGALEQVITQYADADDAGTSTMRKFEQ